MSQRAFRAGLLVIGTAALTACTKTAVVREVQTTRAIETFSIQAIRALYPTNLSSEQAKLAEKKTPEKLPPWKIWVW